MDTLREVEVTYDNDHVIVTNMAGHLTDEQIKDYFKVGKVFNIGNALDNMQGVKEVLILK